MDKALASHTSLPFVQSGECESPWLLVVRLEY